MMTTKTQTIESTCTVRVRADGVVLHTHTDANGKAMREHPAKQAALRAEHGHAECNAAGADLSSLTDSQREDYLALNMNGKEPAWATADYAALTARLAANREAKMADGTWTPRKRNGAVAVKVTDLETIAPNSIALTPARFSLIQYAANEYDVAEGVA